MATRRPILPRSKVDPAGTNDLETKAIRDFQKRLNRLARLIAELIRRIPVVVVQVNVRRYQYLIDGEEYRRLLASFDELIAAVLLEGGLEELWLLELYVLPAMRRGVGAEWANLSAQSLEYAAMNPTLAEVLRRPEYANRVALVKSRVFEEMEGFSMSVRNIASRILADGIARGQNPLQVAKTLEKGIKVSAARARRIARTEIPMALRRAGWDEARDARDQLGIRYKLLHLSALSPTTRETHAERHGNLYTDDEVREWYAEAANAINCKCAQRTLMVDKDGNPLVPSTVERAKQMYVRFRRSS